MPTLVLSQRHTPDSNALWRAALDAGWDVERLRGFACPADLAARDPVIYGETLLADAVAYTLNLALLEPTHAWLPSLPEPWRLRAVRLADAREALALDAPAFIKPVDEKWFPAKVYPKGLPRDLLAAGADDLPVLIAEPVVFEVEYRVFLVERAVADLSPYIRGGEIASSGGEWIAPIEEYDAALEFAIRLLDDPAVALPPAIVVDVGRIQGRGWAVVEANAAWASGICGCDPRAILPVLRRASISRDRLTDEDRPWLRSTG